MRFTAFSIFVFAALLSARQTPQREFNAKDAEAALSGWAKVTCVPRPLEESQAGIALACTARNNPTALPVLIGFATIDEGQFQRQLAVAQSAAADPKVKRRHPWDRVMQKRMALQEHTPGGRLGFYGAHPGLTESALSFTVVDPTTRRSIQLMYTYRQPPGSVSIDEKASAKSMDAIFDKLKLSGFALEKRYWR